MELFASLLAAGDHAAPPLIDIDWTVLVQLGFFLVVLVVLNALVFQPYLALQVEREARIAAAQGDAETRRDAALSQMAHYEQQIGATYKTAVAQATAVSARAEAAAQATTKTARETIEQKLRQGRAELSQSAAQARAALSAETADFAAEIARRVVGRAA